MFMNFLFLIYFSKNLEFLINFMALSLNLVFKLYIWLLFIIKVLKYFQYYLFVIMAGFIIMPVHKVLKPLALT